MSDVLLVMEAGVKGGALIMARIALDYGVPVCAVPGDIDRVASVGTNLLIRDGALPILGRDDLAEVLAFSNLCTNRAAILWVRPRLAAGSHPRSWIVASREWRFG